MDNIPDDRVRPVDPVTILQVEFHYNPEEDPNHIQLRLDVGEGVVAVFDVAISKIADSLDKFNFYHGSTNEADPYAACVLYFRILPEQNIQVKIKEETETWEMTKVIHYWSKLL